MRPLPRSRFCACLRGQGHLPNCTLKRDRDFSKIKYGLLCPMNSTTVKYLGPILKTVGARSLQSSLQPILKSQ